VTERDRLEAWAIVYLVGGALAVVFDSDALLCWCYCCVVYYVWLWGRAVSEE